jgi:hypothetical protein
MNTATATAPKNPPFIRNLFCTGRPLQSLFLVSSITPQPFLAHKTEYQDKLKGLQEINRLKALKCKE